MTLEEFNEITNDFIPLKSTDGRFGINKYAQIINFKTGRMIHTYIGVDMYEHVVLCYNGKKYRKRVHRLMAEAFLNNCKVVDHDDAIKNHNILWNLNPATHSENIAKAFRENDYVNPHKGRGIWIIAENKETKEKHFFKSMRECERFTGVDRHRIKHFLLKERTNLTKFNFYYDE